MTFWMIGRHSSHGLTTHRSTRERNLSEPTRATFSRRTLLTGSTAALAAGSVSAASGANTEYWPSGASWDGASAAVEGFDPGKLAAAVSSIMARESYSLLVVRHGRIVSESYATGEGQTSAHEIASAAKSVVSVLVGIAIDQGKIRSVDQSASDFIPQWKGTPKENITLRHLLTMTSGLEFSNLKVRNISGDQFALNAATPVAHPAGSQWAYATPIFHLLYHVVERAAGEPFATFAKRVLLEPIGVENWSWLTNQGQGESAPVTNYYSALCSARDLARFGLFALHGGRWQGRQLVNADYLRAAISPSQQLNPAYGYLWWENAAPGQSALGGEKISAFGNAPPDTFGAVGAGGQVAIEVPSLDLVVVRQGPLLALRIAPKDFIEPIVGALGA
jgi:CubicO group peptidase (beta-lactamase class C family)